MFSVSRIGRACIIRASIHGQFHTTASCKLISQPRLLKPATKEETTVDGFRAAAVTPGLPLVFARDVGSPGNKQQLPALNSWFRQMRDGNNPFQPVVEDNMDNMVQFEITIRDEHERESMVKLHKSLSESQDRGDVMLAKMLEAEIMRDLEHQPFFRSHFPLRLLLRALQHNADANLRGKLRVYVAQCSILDLAPEMQAGLPTPYLVEQAGKGDVYASSVWLGTEPTYTPLHRDPNPNLFVQLCGAKRIRLMPRQAGDRLFYQIQRKLGRMGNAHFRSEDMMVGEEREELDRAVWGDGIPLEDAVEARLGPGDALYIPKAWWHSVKSEGNEAHHLNASANWWFR